MNALLAFLNQWLLEVPLGALKIFQEIMEEKEVPSLMEMPLGK